MRLLGTLLVLWHVAPASARPSVTLAVDGECPQPAQLREVLAAWVDVSPADGEWTIAVSGESAIAELSLRDATGAVVLSRQVSSPDCAARAEAFGVMIHAHFVELRLLPMPAPAEPVAPAPAPPPATVATVEPTPALRAEQPAPIARMPVAMIALAGGVGVASKDATVSAFGQVEGGWSRNRLLVFAALALDSPTTLEAPMDRIEQWRGSARGGVGYRFDLGDVWLQPAIAAGVVAWRVEPLDLPDESPRWSVQPIGSVGATLGVSVTRQLALRIEPRGTLYFVRDRYVIDPQGVIARSPRGGFEVSVGLEFGWFR